MTNGFSRRRLLTAGGALGAFGAIGLATPASARSLWTWSPSASVAGTGAGIDPEWVWDEEADPVLADVIERGDVPGSTRRSRSGPATTSPCPTDSRRTCGSSWSAPGNSPPGRTARSSTAAHSSARPRGSTSAPCTAWAAA
ncbi:hypothetical protein NKH77_50720 [Streptomyces sp. M19]